MENWARSIFILSSRKKNILVDSQNFEYKFKRERETGAADTGCVGYVIHWDVLQLLPLERIYAKFIKNVKNTPNHSNKLVEKRVTIYLYS